MKKRTKNILTDIAGLITGFILSYIFRTFFLDRKEPITIK